MNSSTNELFADETIKPFSVVRLNECIVTTVGKTAIKVRHTHLVLRRAGGVSTAVPCGFLPQGGPGAPMFFHPACEAPAVADPALSFGWLLSPPSDTPTNSAISLLWRCSQVVVMMAVELLEHRNECIGDPMQVADMLKDKDMLKVSHTSHAAAGHPADAHTERPSYLRTIVWTIRPRCPRAAPQCRMAK
eukprot:scaffold5226_cov100-Isochrysis_galbana.AAC.1